MSDPGAFPRFSSDPAAGATFDQLIAVVRTVRRRWRMRVALRGTVTVLGLGFLVFFASVAAMDHFLYGAGAVRALRALTWITLAALVVRFLAVPLLRRVSDRQVAMYIEEHEPTLEAALLTAVELGPEGAPSASPALRLGVIERAVESCRQADAARRIERPRLQKLASALAGVAGASFLAILVSPAFLQHGAVLLFMPWKALAMDNPYQLQVLPGAQTVPRGSDLRVLARLVGFEADRVELGLRAGEGEWQRFEMSPTDATEAFGVAEKAMDAELMLLDLQESSEYFVEASGMRSAVFRVDVRELPYVERIDLEYRFPKYTGLEPERVEDGGDIAVLVGTEVGLEVIPTVAVSAGWLRLEGGEDVALELGEDGRLRGRFEVSKPSYYRVDLADAEGTVYRASPEYAIRPIADKPPLLEIQKPGRDVKVTKIDELFVEAKVEDDFGSTLLELAFSVNGGDEQTLKLYGGGALKEVVASHTFFLEELDLRDGDFISYYARARDGNRVGGGQTTTSDIYFAEIRPFGQDYRRAPEGGGGMGGGEQESALSQRQREIIAATFKLVRDKSEYEAKEYRENLATVALAEGALRQQVETLVTRMSNRRTLMGDDEFRQIMEQLEAAGPLMDEAQRELEAARPQEALGPEQKALTHLQRAEATFRDVRVSFDASGGGGGGGSQLSEDLADLFELELDKLRNQYEVVQRGEQQQLENAIDELEQKLKELARRQQRENERKARAQPGARTGGGGSGQQQLMEDTEEAARQLERLAREQSRPELRETARRLREAVDNMRRSEASGGGQGQQSAASGISALERLEEAQRLLDKTRNQRLDTAMQEVQAEAQRIADQQKKIANQISQMPREGSEPSSPGGTGVDGRPARGSSSGDEGARLDTGSPEMERVLERKEQLSQQVSDLEKRLDSMARQARGEQPEAARRLQDASNSVRKNQLQEKIDYSKGVVRTGDARYADLFEREISSNIDELLERVGSAAEAMGEESGDKGEDALASARSLVEGLQSLEERLRQRQEGAQQGGQQGGQQQEGQAGDKGESGESGKGGEQSGAEGERGGEGQPGDRRAQDGSQPGDRAGSLAGDRQGEGQGRGSGRLGEQPGSEGAEGQAEGGQRAGGSERGGQAGTRDAIAGAINRIGSSEGGSFQPGLYGTEELRQLGRELQQRTQEAGELRDQLRAEGLSVADLDQILEQMRRFNPRGLNNDPLALGRLREQIVDGLRQFEFRLWRELASEKQQEIRLAGEDEVPEGYRERVEEYYRSLAGVKPPGSR